MSEFPTELTTPPIIGAEYEFGILEQEYPEERERIDLENLVKELYTDVRANIEKMPPAEAAEKARMVEISKSFEKLSQNQIEKLYDRHRDKYYHHPKHSLNLAVTGVKELRRIQGMKAGVVSELDVLIFIAEALGHDAVMKELVAPGVELTKENEKQIPVGKTIMRNRGMEDGDALAGREGNEAKSADELLEEMANDEILKQLLENNKGLRERIRKDIGTTYPKPIFKNNDFKDDFLGFEQPHNDPDVSITGFVLGTEDLARPYNKPLDQSDQIWAEGNAEWKETNRPIMLRIKAALERAGNSRKNKIQAIFKEFPSEQERYLIVNGVFNAEKQKNEGGIVGWLKFQETFVGTVEQQFKKRSSENKVLNDAGLAEAYQEDFNFDHAKKITKQKAERIQAAVEKDYDGKSAWNDEETFFKLLQEIGAVE